VNRSLLITTMPPLIRSRYEQYKRDTQQFTTWLGQTAISLGYPLSKFDRCESEDAEDVPTTKSKKNAKKKARAKEKSKLAREGGGEVVMGKECEDTSGETCANSGFQVEN
jgi:hypothetical protein